MTISFSTLLGVVFIVLKLTGAVSWPWIWVLAPFWLGLALLLGITILTGLILVIALAVTEAKH